MTEADRDRLAYRLAQKYLLGLGVPGVTAELLAHYQRPRVERLRPPDLAGIYEGLLRSAQNRGMAPAVIRRAIGGIENLSSVTFGFNPHQVAQRFGRGSDLLAEIMATLQPRGKVRDTRRSLFPQFCESAVSGARFHAGF